MRRGTPTHLDRASATDVLIRVLLPYAVFAALWILCLDRLVEWFFHESVQVLAVSILKGFLLAVITSVVLHKLIQRLPGGPQGERRTSSPSRLRLLLPSILLGTAIIVLTTGLIVHNFEYERDKQLARLQIIAELKAGQIADWLKERDRDGHFVRTSRFFAETYRRWRDTGDRTSGELLKNRLDEYRDDRLFHGVLLLDEEAEVLWNSEGKKASLDPSLQEAILRASSEGRTLPVGPYVDPEGRSRLDWIAPLLFAGSHPRPVVVLRNDPQGYLFPTLQTWPSPGKTGEILLFRRDGDEVVCLNAHRGRKGGVPMLRLPVTSPDLLTAQFVRGEAKADSPIEGVDLWGIQVLGVARGIPGTDWFLIAKMDRAEAHQEASRNASWIALAGLLALLTVAACAFVFRQRQELVQSEREREVQAEKLRKLQLFDAISERSGDAIYAKDTAGRYLLFNAESGRIMGKRPEDVLGKDDTAIFPPEQAASINASDHAVMERNSTATFLEDLDTVAGKITFLTTKGPLHDDAGNIIGMFGVSRDMTERKRAEDALQRSHSLLLATLESTEDGILVVGTDRKVILFNSKFAEMWRIPATITPGQDNKELLTLVLDQLRDPDEFLETVQRLYQSPDAIAMHELVFRDGRIFERYTQPQRIGDTIVGRVWSFRDVTLRKQAEAALRESEARLLSLINATPDIICFKDARGAWLLANDSLLSLYHLGTDVYRNKTEVELADLAAPIYRSTLKRCSQTDEVAWREGAPSRSLAVIPDEMGTRRSYDVLKIPVTDADGSRKGLVVIGRDMTDLYRAEDENAQLQAQLAHAQKMESVGRLAGGVAHDFNNKIQVILGYTSLALGQTDAGSPVHRWLEEVHKAAQQSADLTRQLLAFARKQTIRLQVLDLNETVSGMLKMLKRIVGEDIELQWLSGSGLWSVNMDPAQIDQILVNLVVNSRDAISGTGTITLKTENVSLDASAVAVEPGASPGDYVLLTVSDTGCGMSQETLKSIFEPYFTTKELGKGTGLGLATVYGIVRQNQGFLNVQSEPGKGTVFRIYLPRFDGTATGMTIEPPNHHPPKGTETVLIVEDEESIMTLGRTILQRQGYRVLTAATPGKALKLAEDFEGAIHLLITDVVMPEMNGRELAERLTALRPGLKCLFMSGYTDDVISSHGVLEEDARFLPKPFSINDVAETVRAILDE